MARRFAEDTRVPVGTSQQEIKKRLKEAGADQLAVYEAADRSSVAFRLANRMFRITIPAGKARSAAQAAQEERRAWRLLLLLIKSKLEAVREGATTVEREFLADMLMPDGSTVAEQTREQIAIAYSRPGAPSTLMLDGPR